MKKAVMYGAGSIGRGFIGKIFSDSGYEVCFIDINQKIVDQLNQDKQYPVRIVFNEDQHEEIVKNVKAVSGMDIDKIADEIACADIMATAVGVNILPKIAKPISLGLKKRIDKNRGPLDIIICENLLEADKYVEELIESEMDEVYKPLFAENIGFVEASIGRMVPVMTDDMREGNALRVWVEPYDKLPVDKMTFKGKIPDLNGLVPYSPFSYFIRRKLFIHNMGHAMCAYLGWQKRYRYIYQCIEDAEICVPVYEAMMESAKALSKEYEITLAELSKYIDDLLYRFGNKALGDTVARVARDPLRKLGANDRLIGAALYCSTRGIWPEFIINGIAAGLQYDNTEDTAAIEMQTIIRENGLGEFLVTYCGLKQNTEMAETLLKYAK